MIVRSRKKKFSNNQYVNMIYIDVHLNFIIKKTILKNEQSICISFKKEISK